MTLPNGQLVDKKALTSYPLEDLNGLPLAIDLYCSLGGWAEGFLAEGYRVIGFDIERHDYGTGGYPGQLVLQDVRTLRGWQFKNAAVIVASPPCQAYSYRAMPWKRAKALPPPDNTLFEQPFRIQREACEAAGRYIPLIVENVRGAQDWVGRSRYNFGSYHLWGDVPALMPYTFAAIKVPSVNGGNRTKVGSGHAFTSRSWEELGLKGKPTRKDGTVQSRTFCRPGGGNRGKQQAALIAKIPFPLAQHIARVFKPATALLFILAFSSPRKVVMDDSCKSSQFPLPFEQVTEVHGLKANPFSGIATLPTSEPQSQSILEPKALPESVLEELYRKHATFTARVMARLSEAERREINTHYRQDVRQAWITLSLAMKDTPEPFVAASYVVYGTHPDFVFTKWLAKQKDRLAAEFGQWYDPQGCLIPEPTTPKIPPTAVAAHTANGASTGTLGPVPLQPKDKEVV